MKKLVFLFLSLLTAGSLFQACDNSKTYAEMLEDEKNAVNKFIKDNDIRVISLEEFERDTITASKEAGNGYDEYLSLIHISVVGELRPAPKIFKETCRIDWNQPVKKIYDFIRGLSPYPCLLYTSLYSLLTIAIWEVLCKL